MNIFPFYDPDLRHDWEPIWPLWFPAWSNDDNRFSSVDAYWEWQRLNERAQERANRRLRKKSEKAARAQGLKRRDRMPGAWPT